MLFYVGCYNTPESSAIVLGQITVSTQGYQLQLIPNDKEPQSQATIDNASFLWVDASNQRLFAVSELEQYQGHASGLLASFDITQPHQPTLINQQLSQGIAPCHLLHWQQRLISCNYGGSIINLVADENGQLLNEGSQRLQHEGKSVNPERQTQSHPHSLTLHPQLHLAYCADLGTDTITTYRLDEQGQLEQLHVTHIAPGSGPRHVAVAPNGATLYAANELNNRIDVFAVEAQGQLRLVQSIAATSPLAEDIDVSYPAEISLSKDGKYAYCSNRGQDSISCFAVAKDGHLSLVSVTPTGGKFPRHFSLSPCQEYVLVANQLSDNLVLFGRDTQTGALSEPLDTISLTGPVCVAFYDHK
ncbi:lactonase family protein [Motilimonas pumila]|uniref:Lactonase family protein n=1 Tax=Motilimonas pumila TaxID=2303987 RepID=A0A418YKG3_9GAMM|nr:lactonase family protein [Motilimonas pumila]RJG51468.1 lactonase family protein [Motilimonas pumila]